MTSPSTSTPTPRAYTPHEVREKLLSHLFALARYWSSNRVKEESPTELDRMDGLIFSILTTLDGGSILPAMNILTAPRPDDKAYRQELGENWYEPGMLINDCQLHEQWCAWRRGN